MTDQQETEMGEARVTVEQMQTAVDPKDDVIEGEIVDDAPGTALACRTETAPAWYEPTLIQARQVAARQRDKAVSEIKQGPKDAGQGVGILFQRWLDWVFVAHLRQAGRRDKMPLPQHHQAVTEAMKKRAGMTAGALALTALADAGELMAQHGPGTITWGGIGAISFACWLRGSVTRRRETRIARKVAGEFTAPATDGIPDEMALTRAFQDAGILKAPSTNQAGEITRPGQALRLIEKSFAGHYWTVIVELPSGITAAQATKRHGEIASALGSSVPCVHLRPIPTFAARLEMIVFSSDPMATAPVTSPLVNLRSASVFDANRVGTVATGGLVEMCMLERSLVCGAMPGQGKTNFLRLIAAVAVLDPMARLIVFDGKPDNVDTADLAKVSERFAQGNTNAAARKLLSWLDDVYDEGMRRFGLFAKRPGRKTSKITREIHEDASPRWKDLSVIYVIIDECHIPLSCTAAGDRPDKDGKDTTVGKLIEERLIDIIKTPGRAGGIQIILATQDLADKGGFPSSLRKVISDKCALRVDTWRESNAVLGDGQVEAGWDASDVLSMHRGVALLRHGAGADAMKRTKLDLLEPEEFSRICDRGRELREQHGTLRGDAVTWTPDTEQDDDKFQDADQAEQPQSAAADAELPEILAAVLAYLLECREDGDDREIVPSLELFEEAELGSIELDGKAVTETRAGRELSAMGVGKAVEPGRGGRVGRRVADVFAAVERIAAGGPVHIVDAA